MNPDLEKCPRLGPGCRLNDKNQRERMLLMPERALRLNGPSLAIIERCDGAHSVREIISELQTLYAKANPQKVESDILEYLKRLEEQRALEFG